MQISSTPEEAVAYAGKLWRSGRPKPALELCAQVLKVAPALPSALDLAFAILRDGGDVAVGDAAIAAMAMQAAGRFEDACAAFARLAEMLPADGGTRFHWATNLYAAGRYGETATRLAEAASLAPHSTDMQMCVGKAFADLGEFAAARACFERACRLAPDNHHTHTALAGTLLRTGAWEQGWQEFEWRHQIKAGLTWRWPMLTATPKELAGKRVLLGAEQGYGDAIQFARLVPLLRDACRELVWEVYPALLPLFEGQFDGVSVIATGAQAQPHDIALPIMSLGKLYSVTPERVPGGAPYLKPNAAKVEQWRGRLATGRKLRIGVVWAGSEPHSPRSPGFGLVDALLGAADAQFFLLQKEPGRADLLQRGCPADVLDLGGEIESWDDTAAIMAQLDLIISADTATAHLAGALGCRVWVALPFTACWRWLADPDETPWYPSARLFRQSSLRDWTGVFARMRSALDSLAR